MPTHVNFPITDNCNSKCQMCNVWKDKSENELLPKEIADIFSDQLFANVKHLGISGGEPTLRNDLLDCVDAILESLPKLESLSITSHGFHPSKWERMLPEILKKCQKKNVLFKLNISVDGIGELHEEVRRIEGGWKKVLKSIAVAKKNNCPLQIQCTVSKHNVYGINEVLHFAKENNIELIFRKATSINRLYNESITDEYFTSNNEDSFFADFLQSKSLNEATGNPGRRLFYKDLVKRLVKGTKRGAPCHFQYNGVLISAHGEMFHCSIDEKPLGNCRKESPSKIYFSKESKNQLDQLLSQVCPNCIHDQTGSWSPLQVVKEVLSPKLSKFIKFKELFSFGLKNISASIGFIKRNVILDLTENKKTLHVIGAYGGEHVGDSAILGGVLLRHWKKDPTLNNIVVYSKRADRTQFWVKGLDLEIGSDIQVKDYKVLNNIKVSKNDKLVWAGGPIMEMPVDLFEHLLTIKAFTKKGIPFYVTGCGWGPFKTRYSLKKAHQVLNSASEVEMRDKYSSLGSQHTVNQDPAFDYLYSQKTKSKLDWSWSRFKIDDFLKKIKKENQKLVLVNLRPLWDKYNKSNKSSDELDEEVILKIFETLKMAGDSYQFVSVPFNTDHYGFSDMEPALVLKDLCKREAIKNYHLFDRELDARDMLYLLANFDMGICMRFHACIFMKSMNIPVYGIDYTAGEKGKVAGLFDSFNDPNYGNIMTLDPKRIVAFLNDGK
ncbi:polysaccharide pyruvyl transferase family protein [Flagellimonas sediminis]|uniref:Radical SAM protein n=1 Tax=Flagellimonas sediminis TaxID=2696468 RepID=A0A6I5KMT9_9FLAO|nr:polysaccharide pyruvyl transferase family protein [Allomuricauda sediminis]NDV42144.1 radical SAM protein [Allomuricauda sediminis]